MSIIVTILRLEKDWRDGRTDRRTQDRYIALTATRGQRNNALFQIYFDIVEACFSLRPWWLVGRLTSTFSTK